MNEELLLNELYQLLTPNGDWRKFERLLLELSTSSVCSLEIGGEAASFSHSPHEALYCLPLAQGLTLKISVKREAYQPRYLEENIRMFETLVSHLNRCIKLLTEQASDQLKPSLPYILDRFDTGLIHSGDQGIETNEKMAEILAANAALNTSDIMTKKDISRAQYDLEEGLHLASHVWVKNIRLIAFYGLAKSLEEKLQSGWGLSKSEAKVAAILISGLNLEETAKYLDRSKETIRTHSKRVYQKLNVRNQVELMVKARDLGTS